jgi:hypothetical protein
MPVRRFQWRDPLQRRNLWDLQAKLSSLVILHKNPWFIAHVRAIGATLLQPLVRLLHE